MKNIEHEIDIKIIKSEKTNLAGVEVGVQVTHKESELTASNTSDSSQYPNKLAALALLICSSSYMTHLRESFESTRQAAKDKQRTLRTLCS